MTKKTLSRKLLSALVAVILLAVIAAPVLASLATATRSLPASTTSGAIFDVTIDASGCGFAGQVVETLPDGFAYLSCTSDDIGIEQAGNTVKFTFLGDSVSFTYRVKAPMIATTAIYTFHGIVKDENKNEYPIEDNDITVTVDAPPSETYTLTIEIDGNGSTAPSVGSHTYDDGDVVNIGATGGSGWRFDSWSSNVADPDSSSTTVTMNSNKTVTAYFTLIPSLNYILTVTCKPSVGGRITCSPAAEDYQYEDGAVVELTAIPVAGYVFFSWGGDSSGSINPTSITIDSDKNVIANFVLPESERPASFAVSPLNISPEQVQPNQPVEISINIANTGEEAGNYEAILYINEQIESSQEVSIHRGLSKDVMFNITRLAPGTYTVSLGEQRGQFTVVEGQSTTMDNRSTDSGLDTGSIVGIVIIAALIAALVFVFRRIRKRV